MLITIYVYIYESSKSRMKTDDVWYSYVSATERSTPTEPRTAELAGRSRDTILR